MSSSVLTEFEPGVVYDIRIGNGSGTRHVAGVDYSAASDLLGSRSANGWDFNLVGNGAIERVGDDLILEINIAGGSARLVNTTLERTSRCFEHVAVAVAEADDWEWAKVKIKGGHLDGYACIGIRHDTGEAIAVSLETMMAAS